VVELSRSFECVYVEIGKDREFARRYTAGRIDVVFLDSKGGAIGRYTPDKLYSKGDASALVEAMKAALEEHSSPSRLPRSRAADNRVGVDAGKWKPESWLQGEACSLKDLRGKVVVVRWFTDSCPFCAASMPALQALQDRYADSGLLVIGVYHSKPRSRSPDRESVRKLLKGWKVAFPIAMDTKWKMLEAWWLKTGKRSATSVTFVIGKQGKIRFVHPGPELHAENMKCSLEPERCHADYADLERAIRILLDS